MEVKRMNPVSVLLDEKMSTPKKNVWDIEFSSGLKGKLMMDPASPPVQVGGLDWFGYEEKTYKDGSGNYMLITYPAPPQLRKPEPGEVTQPITNPVVSTTEVPAQKPYKAPDRDRLIVRQVCAKLAVEYISSLSENPAEPLVAAKLMAQQWEQWMYRSVE